VSNRDEVRRLARESIARGDATGWFETLYRVGAILREQLRAA
jgi:hypothetical protein